MGRKATPAQIDLAKKLGIEYEGLSLARLSQVISHVIRRKELEDKGLQISNETNDQNFAGISKPNFARKATDCIRAADLKEADIVDHYTGRYALRTLAADRASLIPLHGGTWRVVAPVSFRNKEPRCLLSRVYRPPETHMPRCLAIPSNINKYNRSDFKTKTRHFQAFVDERLPLEDRLTNEFGEFWTRARVNQYLTAFLEEADAKQATKETAPLRPKKFCVACGKRILTGRGGTSLRCKTCVNVELGDERYCRICGTHFTRNPTLSGVTNTFCPTHRKNAP